MGAHLAAVKHVLLAGENLNDCVTQGEDTPTTHAGIEKVSALVYVLGACGKLVASITNLMQTMKAARADLTIEQTILSMEVRTKATPWQFSEGHPTEV